MKGSLTVPKYNSVPPHEPEDEGKIFYSGDTLYYSDSTTQVSILSSGGGAATGNAAKLEGQTGAYYLCADNFNGNFCIDNITGTINADQLGGQVGSYYLCANNATGTLAVANGGTGGTTASTARSNLGLTGTSNTSHYHDSRYPRVNTANTWTCCNCFSAGVKMTDAVYVCSSVGGFGVRGTSAGNYTLSTFYGCSTSGYMGIFWNYCCNGLIGVGNGPGAAVCGQANGGGYSVKGNTGYNVASSKNIKHLNDVCLSNCLRENPINVYRYYWEDSNYKGFDQTIGPVAEDFNNTFNVSHSDHDYEYPTLWTVDGVALGLGIENVKEIDKLKEIVVKLYSCIQKLEGKEI